jgi:Ca2+-binding EF-hand superfamily protein
MSLLSQSAAQNAAAAVSDATDEELEQAANCFSMFDADRDGVLSTAEFGEMLRAVHRAEGEPAPSGEQADAIFARADLNANGSLDFNEFLRFHAIYISVKFKDLLRAKERAGVG